MLSGEESEMIATPVIVKKGVKRSRTSGQLDDFKPEKYARQAKKVGHERFDRTLQSRQLIKDAVMDMFLKFNASHCLENDEGEMLDMQGRRIRGVTKQTVTIKTVSILAVEYFFSKNKGKLKDEFGKEIVKELRRGKESLRVHIINMFVWVVEVTFCK